jgi:uncharacterized protein YciI
MPFLIDATDKPDSAELRAKTRPEHLEFLKASLPKLLAAGAKLSDDGATAFGSAYIVDVETRAEAEAFINADPFTKAGLFGTVNISRWRKGFFDRKAL